MSAGGIFRSMYILRAINAPVPSFLQYFFCYLGDRSSTAVAGDEASQNTELGFWIDTAGNLKWFYSFFCGQYFNLYVVIFVLCVSHTIFLCCCRQKICKKPWWSLSSSLKTFRGTNMKWVWILACHGDGHTPAEMVMLTNGLCMTSECCGQNVQLHVIGYHLENYEWCEVVWLALQVCQLVVAFNTAYGFWH